MSPTSSGKTFLPVVLLLGVFALVAAGGLVVAVIVGMRFVLPTTQAAVGGLQSVMMLPIMAMTQTVETLNSGSSEDRKVILVELDRTLREMPPEQLTPELIAALTPPLQKSASDADQQVAELATQLINFMNQQLPSPPQPETPPEDLANSAVAESEGEKEAIESATNSAAVPDTEQTKSDAARSGSDTARSGSDTGKKE